MNAAVQQTFTEMEKSHIIPFPNNYKREDKPRVIAQMVADTEDLIDTYKRVEQKQDEGRGMDSFPMDVYNSMIDYYMQTNELRNAMFLICMANWGTRFGDTCRVRFCHIFNADGTFKTEFTLPDGEEKTSKKNIYYNNNATRQIITMFLEQNPDKKPYDYMFVSDSNHKTYVTLQDIEAEELYGAAIKTAEKKLAKNKKKIESLYELHADNEISGNEFAERLSELKAEKTSIETELYSYQYDKDHYESKSKLAYHKFQTPATRRGIETMIKNTLTAIGIFPKNGSHKDEIVNLEKKLNTHSLRKTFGEYFYKTGCRLKADGILDVDLAMLQLLQHKFMHTNNSTTSHYNRAEEEAFMQICTNMNLGYDVLSKYE